MRAQVETARAQWLAEEDGGIDDCTAIVCILHHSPVPLHSSSAASADASKAVGAISRSSALHGPITDLWEQHQCITPGDSSLHSPRGFVHCLLLLFKSQGSSLVFNPRDFPTACSMADL